MTTGWQRYKLISEWKKRLSALSGFLNRCVHKDLRTNHCQVGKRRAKVDYSWAHGSKTEGKLNVVGEVSATLERFPPAVQGTILYWLGDLDAKIIIVLKVMELDWIKPWLNQWVLFSASKKDFSVCQMDSLSCCSCLCPCLHLHDGLCLLSCMYKTLQSQMCCIITDAYCTMYCRPVLQCCHLKTVFKTTIIWSAYCI